MSPVFFSQFMAKIAPPDWIFHTLAALTAAQMLRADLAMDDFSEHAGAVLAKTYPGDAELVVEVWALAVDMLHVLSDAEVDDAPDLLCAFAEHCLLKMPNGHARRLKRLFGSVLDAEEKSRYRVEEGARVLRHFTFAVSNGVRPVCNDDFPRQSPPELAPLLDDFLLATHWFADEPAP